MISTKQTKILAEEIIDLLDSKNKDRMHFQSKTQLHSGSMDQLHSSTQTCTENHGYSCTVEDQIQSSNAEHLNLCAPEPFKFENMSTPTPGRDISSFVQDSDASTFQTNYTGVSNIVTPHNMDIAVRQCAGCNQTISDRFLLHACERFWHSSCLTCDSCHVQLGDIAFSCYAREGRIFCKNDYLRLFGTSGTCHSCKQNIPAEQHVMRAQTFVYHVNCFTCVICRIRLLPGDRYTLCDGQLLCEHDFPKVMIGSLPYAASHKNCGKN